MGKKTPVCSQNNKLANPEVEMLQMKWEHPLQRDACMECCGVLSMACFISSSLLTDLNEVTEGNWEKDIRCFKLMPEKRGEKLLRK